MLKKYWIVSFCMVACLSINLPAHAQTEPEQKPRRSYIGIGGNVGLSGGDTAIGDEGFAIVNRTRIIEYLSVRGSVIFASDISSTTALTGELPITNQNGDVMVTPFLGGGFAIEDGDFNPLISAGADVPLSQDFTLTNRINVSFGDETNVGALVGVGYNFTLF